jgi:hypothetical protein
MLAQINPRDHACFVSVRRSTPPDSPSPGGVGGDGQRAGAFIRLTRG